MWGTSMLWESTPLGPSNAVEKSPPVVVEKAQPKAAAKAVRVTMKVTAYCADCSICNGKWADGRTALNDDARVCDGVAAAPNLIPYRTRLSIPGVGIKEVDDTGGAMRQAARKGIYHIDVRFLSHDEAKRFGVKWLDVEVLD